MHPAKLPETACIAHTQLSSKTSLIFCWLHCFVFVSYEHPQEEHTLYSTFLRNEQPCRPEDKSVRS